MKKYLLLALGTLMLVGCGATKSLPTQSASTTYKVGDIYNQGGVKGIVVEVDGSGRHGKIMSLESSKGKWLANKDLKFATNAFYEDDGEKNLDAIAACIKENDASWNDFPIFQWARSLGDGWYVPSKNELGAMVSALERALKNTKGINKQVTSYGGDKWAYHDTHSSLIFGYLPGWLFDNDLIPYTLYSSTERDEGQSVYSSDQNLQKGAAGWNYVRTRALKKF